MKPISRFLVAAGAVVLAGCGSVPIKVDTGPIHARTFNFVDGGVTPVPTYGDNREAVHAMIQDAITKTFTSRGMTRVTTGGDVTVAYLVIIGNNVSTRSINDCFGYSDDAWALHEKAQAAYTSTRNPSSFEAGTLLIDLIEAKGFNVRRRDYATRPVLRNLPDDARAARIQEVVDEILRDVRIGP
ncbi:MAG: DUF4136 domain-containing protein [Candidatus Rokuibacteriota bacterium]